MYLQPLPSKTSFMLLAPRRNTYEKLPASGLSGCPVARWSDYLKPLNRHTRRTARDAISELVHTIRGGPDLDNFQLDLEEGQPVNRFSLTGNFAERIRFEAIAA